MRYGVRWKQRSALAALFFLMFLSGGCGGFSGFADHGQLMMTEEAAPETSASVEDAADQRDAASGTGTNDGESYDTNEERIYVHICGCVRNPGLYVFAAGTRAGEALESAGGFTKKADESAVNLAAVLQDGMQLYVPSVEDTVQNGAGSASSGAVGNAASAGAGNVTSGSGKESAPVNINTAGAQELMTLSGIGESRAEAILSYREENGMFSSIEDIKNVSGIGEGIFERIKNMITV